MANLDIAASAKLRHKQSMSGIEWERRSLPLAAAARLLDQLARALHAHGHQHGLFPAQWAALRYFARVESPHDTAMGLATFQGLAFGSVARTVRTLIDKGLLKKAGSAGRGRAEKVILTDMGRALLRADPLRDIGTTLEGLTPIQLEALVESCERILRTIQANEQSGGLD